MTGPSGPPKIIFFQEILPGDLKKFRAESNIALTGGGARDLRVPVALVPQISPMFSQETGKPGVVKGTVRWVDLRKRERHATVELWRPTKVRPTESRLGRIYEIDAWRVDEAEYAKARKRDEKWFYVLALDPHDRVWARILKEPELGLEERPVARFIRRAIADTPDQRRVRGVVSLGPVGPAARSQKDALEGTVAANIERAAGFQSNPAIRRVVEEWAMRCARRYLTQKYTDVEDTSANHPFDYTCRLGERKIYVEVKGTQTPGMAVSLSPNEKSHAEQHGHDSLLYIQHSIRVVLRKKPKAFGGKRRVLNPWLISEGKLKPSGWVFYLPKK